MVRLENKDGIWSGKAQAGIQPVLRAEGNPAHHSPEGVDSGPKEKHATQKSLREVKKDWRLFEQICVDTKYLCDIPQYWPQMTGMDLPRFRYTARDVTSGLVFVAYADDISKTYATLFSAVISEHLRFCGVDLAGIEWQSDNGSEFKDSRTSPGLPRAIPYIIYRIGHVKRNRGNRPGRRRRKPKRRHGGSLCPCAEPGFAGTA